MTEVMWTPGAAMAEQSALAKFAREAGFEPSDYESLHRWSIAEPGAFWSQLWDFAGVIGEKGEAAFVPDPAHWMTGARFFPDAKINLAENLLKRTGDAVVVVEGDEAGGRRELTADQLRAESARVANGLRAAGVRPGDRVAAV